MTFNFGQVGSQHWVGIERPGFKHHIYGASLEEAQTRHAAFCRQHPAFIKEHYEQQVPEEAGR